MDHADIRINISGIRVAFALFVLYFMPKILPLPRLLFGLL